MQHFDEHTARLKVRGHLNRHHEIHMHHFDTSPSRLNMPRTPPPPHAPVKP
jgi:hypothetical protein